MTDELRERLNDYFIDKIKEPLPENLILASEKHARAKLLAQGRSFENLDEEYLVLFIVDVIKQLEFSAITCACSSVQRQKI